MNKLLIYTQQTSPRVSYIFDFMLGELLGLEYELTQDAQRFTNFDGPKFSYADEPLGDEIFFRSAKLLFENGVFLQPIDYCEHEKLTGFYLTAPPSRLPFDPFASAFFMITCYNEYLLNKKDKYDRYRASQSMNFKAGFLDKPMINYYALELKKILKEKFASLTFKQNKFEYIATFDIDMAYSYLEKGFQTNFGGFMRSLLLSDFQDMRTRYNVIFKGAKDPFDTYDYIFDVCNQHQIKTLFFILVGDKSKFDKNIEYYNEKFRELIKDIAAETELGIHLSFRSHISNGVMQDELERLEEMSGQEIVKNRFHYLRYSIPASFIRLQRIGIKEDYSMGYATRIGFRAATCTPFYFFNLTKNEVSDLKIHPFAFMDATLTHYNRYNWREGLDRIRHIMKSVHEVGGPFLGLWHNSSFTEQKQWKGWRKVFETVAQEAAALMHE